MRTPSSDAPHRAMEANGDGRAGAQPKRGSPAMQRDPATHATGVPHRRSYRRQQKHAIPPLARDIPHGHHILPHCLQDAHALWALVTSKSLILPHFGEH